MHVLGASLASNPLSPGDQLSNFGLAGLAIVLFAETGLLVGFFLPGDTLLLAGGILVSVGRIHVALWEFLVCAPIAVILGNLVGYLIGYRAGPVVFDRPNSRMFRPEYVTRAQAFFDRFGLATVLVARFVPIVRTVAPIMAGVGRMRWSLFVVASIVGGLIWTDGLLLAGYWLGHLDFVQRNEGKIDYVILVVVLLGLVPAAVHYVQGRRRARPRSRGLNE
jgi:membrane-associated protein